MGNFCVLLNQVFSGIHTINVQNTLRNGWSALSAVVQEEESTSAYIQNALCILYLR